MILLCWFNSLIQIIIYASIEYGLNFFSMCRFYRLPALDGLEEN